MIKSLKQYLSDREKLKVGATITGVKVKFLQPNWLIRRNIENKLTFRPVVFNRAFLEETIKQHKIKCSWFEDQSVGAIFFYVLTEKEKQKIMNYIYPHCPAWHWGGVKIGEMPNIKTYDN